MPGVQVALFSDIGGHIMVGSEAPNFFVILPSRMATKASSRVKCKRII